MSGTVSLGLAAGLLLLAAVPAAADAKPRVVIYNGVATEVAAAPDASADLWVTPADLTKATKFEVKPEGVCSGRLCFPLPKDREEKLVSHRGGDSWFNFSEFARLLRVPAAHDAKNGVWYFGPRPEEQNGYLKSLIAPDFTLADLDGKKHSLADFRGKKVLLITWASW
jgi:hypothetical protein